MEPLLHGLKRSRARFAVAAAVMTTLLALWLKSVSAADEFEPDDDAAFTRLLLHHGMPPVQRDTDPKGKAGNTDVDFTGINAFPNRSYEVALLQRRVAVFGLALERIGFDGIAVLQSGIPWGSQIGAPSGDTVSGYLNTTSIIGLRWIEPSPGVTRGVRVTGVTNQDYPYSIQLRETTLYCPRYNNTGSQVSVLLVHRAVAGEPTLSGSTCSAKAIFLAENAGDVAAASTVTGSATQTIGPGNTWTLAAASLPGVAGTRGGVRIAHTCGWGGLVGKLVKLDPVTGFSFDTPCETRPPY